MINILTWPEKALDLKPKVISPGSKLRRVLSFSTSSRVSSDWLTPQDVGGGLKRVHHSSGDLGLLWTEHQERTDMVSSLADVSKVVLEEEDDFFEDATEVEHDISHVDDQFKSNHRYRPFYFLFFFFGKLCQ